MATALTTERLVLKFGGSLVEQLGAQLYPSATATVAELISNAWDADAKNVWISIPFGESWTKDSEITVVDDGHGMTPEDAQNAYLIVGRKRRLASGDLSEGGRPLHGRKGIGKLAAFGTAGILECFTRKGGQDTSFRLDYDAIRRLTPDVDYEVEPAEDIAPLTNSMNGEALVHGTRIRLTRLWLKRALSEDQFVRSMSRRFALEQNDMKVFINGKQLGRFDIPVQFRFPKDAVPDGVEMRIDDDGWAVETIEGGQEVRWWIGFTKEPIKDETLQGISVLARGKMAQRPFTFERGLGTTGQLGQEYLVGEVQADWLDEGVDIEDDLIQSNRDQLQLEDGRLQPFIQWGQKRLAWALRRRGALRAELIEDRIEEQIDVGNLLDNFTKRERNTFLGIARSFSKLPEVSPSEAERLLRDVVNAHSDVHVRSMMEEIQMQEEPFQAQMWKVVHEFGLVDARRLKSLIELRLTTIDRLQEAVEHGAREVPDIHNIVKSDSWLLDPRWDLYDDEVDLDQFDLGYEPEEDEDGQQADYLFVLQPRSPAPLDEVVVVEIKRGTHPDLRTRKATDAEVNKFSGYVGAVAEFYARNSEPPTVQGLMIAQDYTPRAKTQKRVFEQATAPRMRFKTWGTVIEETKRMHLGWLHVSQRRAED